MPTGTARTADEITDSIRTLVDRLVDAEITKELTRRGQEVAGEVGSMANQAWRDSRPMRRDARKYLEHSVVDASKTARSTWKRSLRPMLKDLWQQRTVAMGTAGAAIPAGKAVIDDTAVRLGLKQREDRHWGAFFLGLLVGAAIGAIAALLTTPKRGSEMRDELGTRAEELAAKAKDEWVPIFQRETNGAGATLPGESVPGEASIEAAATSVQ